GVFMTIDFHDSRNKSSYSSRMAEEKWFEKINTYVDVQGKRILDLGCGGGIYTKVFAESGAREVTAMDFSAEMLQAAKENCKELKNITYLQGSAQETN